MDGKRIHKVNFIECNKNVRLLINKKKVENLRKNHNADKKLWLFF